MAPDARPRTPDEQEYDDACEALRRVVADAGAATYAFHDALTRLARTARVARVPPGKLLDCLGSVVTKSALGRARAGRDGEWLASARRLVATEYYR